MGVSTHPPPPDHLTHILQLIEDFLKSFESRSKGLWYDLSMVLTQWLFVVPDFGWKTKKRKNLNTPESKFLPVFNGQNKNGETDVS